MSIDPHLTQIADCLYRVSAKAVIVQDGKVLLVREKDDDWWSLPGGGIDYGENLMEGLVREIIEELGVPAESIQIEASVAFATIGAVVDGIPKANLFYRVAVPAGKITPTEHVIATEWFAWEQLADLYLSPSTGPVVEQLKPLMRP